MFNKEYPKSCTMFDTSFERSYKTNHRFSQAFFVDISTAIYFGSGSWIHPDPGMFSTWKMVKDGSPLRLFTGFRGCFYVQ
jgi:hypothetical protein